MKIFRKHGVLILSTWFLLGVIFCVGFILIGHGRHTPEIIDNAKFKEQFKNPYNIHNLKISNPAESKEKNKK